MKILHIEQPCFNDNIFSLYVEGYYLHYNARKDKYTNRDLDNLKQLFLSTLESTELVYAIDDNNNVLGYLLFQYKVKVSKVLYIEEIIVNQKFRNNGVGKALILKVEDIAKQNNCDSLELCCWNFNHNAFEFYKHLNFSEQRTIFEKKI